MKKLFILCLTILLSLSSLTSCGITNYKPYAIKHKNSDCASPYAEIFLTNLLNDSKWQNSVANCACDYEIIMTNHRQIFYHSECGTFIDYGLDKSLTVSEEDRVKLNDSFVESICESGVHFFDENNKCTACGYALAE